MDRERAQDFDQELLDLYDDYAHGRLSRRDFASRAAAFAVGGITAEALLERLSPNYALAQQVAADDPRIKAETITYESPRGGGKMKGLLARPKADDAKFPAVLVIHENRGLNPYIADVARRLAVQGFLALAPDALSPLGGYPGNDDEGRAMQAKRDPAQMIEDFIAAAELLKAHPKSNGKVGAVGFCYGGGVVNTLAVRIPGTIAAGVPFYGRQPRGGRPQDQGPPPDPLRGPGHPDQRGVARVREGAEGVEQDVRGPHLPERQPRVPQRHDPALRQAGRGAGLDPDDRVLQEAPGLILHDPVSVERKSSADVPHGDYDRLPRHRPHLNVIERFWRVLRRRATHNRLFDHLADLRRSVRNRLYDFQTARGRVARICKPAPHSGKIRGFVFDPAAACYGLVNGAGVI